MKKMIIGICILLVVICLIPKRVHLEDGGSVVYKAILYQVKDVHMMGAEDPAEGEYLDGTVVKILGIEVYNDVNLRYRRRKCKTVVFHLPNISALSRKQ